MKKKRRVFLFLLLMIVLSLLFGSIILYQTAVDGIKSDKEKAREFALRETEMVTVDHVEWFHYKEAYYVVFGKTKEDQDIIVWIPKEDFKNFFVKMADEGLSEKEVIELLYNGLDHFSTDDYPKEIIRVKLGIVDDFPAYEITYIDQKDRYSFIYIDFYKGEWYRVYHL
ncbi:DUF5590 domain-containing protein [Fervidibacillus halotolerans]|uniref:DUF5590 domain-containing protein n=1 Tax=Fervidibacillus halotolerans TaxID=2980027 RepID=A0A9E8M357_9BACI|nr:DUF5590 domain-containing protein [Fervidibacillus halotolerans]WAA13736.1 DUF5590 domain-containing protein [Fervidibacillus halotolerans]